MVSSFDVELPCIAGVHVGRVVIVLKEDAEEFNFCKTSKPTLLMIYNSLSENDLHPNRTI